jgi:hypothetical protein
MHPEIYESHIMGKKFKFTPIEIRIPLRVIIACIAMREHPNMLIRLLLELGEGSALPQTPF